MHTLIELYDERAIENVLGPDMFRPERIVYLCPEEAGETARMAESLQAFFALRGYFPQIRMVTCSLFKADRILQQLRKLHRSDPDCAIDVTGGTDAALFGAGLFCAETGVPAFTYSRRMNRFYDISNAPFADDTPCTMRYSVELFFAMAGGRLRPGRVDNQVLAGYMDRYDPFFRLFLNHRRDWPSFITYMQRISQHREEGDLHVSGDWHQKGEHGRPIQADPALLSGLQAIGLIADLELAEGERVAFTFADEQIRAWLRDVGSVLELYMYKACVDAGIFDDVISSAVVDWDRVSGPDPVMNEIDVMAARGVMPLFISCKATEVKTEALNELAILRDRFGGKGAKAAIATTEPVRAATRHRAAQLDIAVIDLEELDTGRAADRLKVLMKVREELDGPDKTDSK